MQLKIITGRAGVGKSYTVLAEIAKKSAEKPIGSPLLLLVPEQATFNAEWSLLNDFNIAGSLRIRVCGFRKLFNLLAAEQNIVLKPWLNDLGKSMILRKIVNSHQQDFTVFRKASRHKGFIDNLRLMVDELAEFEISEQSLLSARRQLTELGKNQMTAEKLADIALVYREYSQKILDNYCDETRLLHILADAVQNSEILSEAEVWLDGFTDFDPAQVRVVKALIKKCRSVTVALTMSENQNYDENSIFAFSEKTFGWLCAFAEDENIPLRQKHLLENHRFKDGSALNCLETAFAKKCFVEADCKNTGNVKIIRAVNTEKQLDFAAEEILRLVRDENYRMSDFAVVSRNLDGCRSLVEETLSAYNIPHFADTAKNMYHHPLIETVLAMLETEAENWQSSAVMRFLKAGLAEADLEELYLLENYALANGIKGSYWQKAGNWGRYYVNNINLMQAKNETERQQAESALAKINEIGRNCLKPLLTFHFDMKGLDKKGGKYLLSDVIGVITQSLDNLQAEEVMDRWSQEAAAEGSAETAAFHRQIFTACKAMLRQLTDFLGDMYADLTEIYDLIAEGGSKMELNSIPPAVDEVIVCDISRTRMPKVRCAFVIDCNEGVFPMRVTEDGLLNSLEREELRDMGLNLAVGQRQLQFAEDYHIYMALTRASEVLYLCYSEFDSVLNPLQPSVLLENVHAVLPGISEVVYRHDSKTKQIFNNQALLTELEMQIASAKNGSDIADIWWQILKYYQKEKMYSAELGALQTGLAYEKDSGILPEELLQSLYGSGNTTSVSRVEVYNRCPCMYYGRYGLKLEPRQEFKMRSQDVGQVYHSILAEVLERLMVEQADFAALGAADVLPLIEQALTNYDQKGIGSLFDDSEKNRYLRDKIIAVVAGCLLDIAYQLAQGDFRPVAFEVAFGEKSEIDGLTVELPGGKTITVHGFIDRIDWAAGGQGEYYRIIDYKSSAKNLDLNDIYYGLNWQMPIYLEALLNSRRGKGDKIIKPAGMFYFPVREVVEAVDKPDERRRGKVQKLQGLVILDDEAIRLAETDFFEERSAKTMDLKLNKNGSYGKNAKAIMNVEYDVLVEYIKKHLSENLQNILQGDIRQLPVLKDDRLSCDFCDFRSLCLLDNCINTDFYQISDQKPEDIMHKMQEDIGWYEKATPEEY
ncbi:MAG: PD-(D/E)XK nuclease family protein [Bacillota bacterium]